MRLLAIITICKTSLALSHTTQGGTDTPANLLRHMTNDAKWKSAESELHGFYARSSLPEIEVISLNGVMNKLFEEHHSTFVGWPSDVTQSGEADPTVTGNDTIRSTVMAAPMTITITNGTIETVTEENPQPTADNTATPSINPETESSSANHPIESGPTPTSYSETTPSSVGPSPASTGSSNHAPTQSFGVVLLALGAFFL